MAWDTEGVIENPTEGQIMADTGAILLGIVAVFTIIIWGETETSFEIAVRNAANNADVNVQRISANKYLLVGVPLSLGVNQRVVVRSVAAASYNYQASILR